MCVYSNQLWLSAGLHTGDFGWGSPTFAKAGREKVRLIKTFLELGVQVNHADKAALRALHAARDE
jgi:hypothetical protein